MTPNHSFICHFATWSADLGSLITKWLTRRDFQVLMVLQTRLTQYSQQNQGYSTSPSPPVAGTLIALRINPICVPFPLVYNTEINCCSSDLKHAFLEKFILVLSSGISGFVSFVGLFGVFLKHIPQLYILVFCLKIHRRVQLCHG